MNIEQIKHHIRSYATYLALFRNSGNYHYHRQAIEIYTELSNELEKINLTLIPRHRKLRGDR